MKLNITKDFTWDEMMYSHTAKVHGIDNRPSVKERSKIESAIEELVKRLLQPLRMAYGKPIRISSGYRCPALNNVVGGVPTSQHMKGEAADCVVRGDASKLLGLLLAGGFPFDQAILYKKRNFLHLSLRANNNRQQIVVR